MFVDDVWEMLTADPEMLEEVTWPLLKPIVVNTVNEFEAQLKEPINLELLTRVYLHFYQQKIDSGFNQKVVDLSYESSDSFKLAVILAGGKDAVVKASVDLDNKKISKYRELLGQNDLHLTDVEHVLESAHFGMRTRLQRVYKKQEKQISLHDIFRIQPGLIFLAG